MQAYAIFLMGTILGVAGLCFLFFRARRTVPHEIILGTVMSILGWAMAIVGGVIVLIS